MEQDQGLTSRQARRLLEQHGENSVKAHKKSGALKVFAGQFRDGLIMILLAATVLSVLMGETGEALTIIAIVFLNAVLGFLQEYRTERTLEKLSELSAPTAIVVRDGNRRSIEARFVVPGDLILLQAGDRVPADGQILSAEGLMCDESMLSGESEHVEKTAGGPKGKVYMGTMVTHGKGSCRVVATGHHTEMGKIAGMLGGIEAQQTPLQKKLGQLGKYIGIGCVGICAVVAITGILRGEPVLDMLLTGISLSVAAVPEGLPAIVTIVLALSVGRMVKRNALVRRLHAVETLGCANVICSDKTGTLTENRMAVVCFNTAEGEIRLSEGDFLLGNRRISPLGERGLSCLLEIAVVCNNAVEGGRRGLFGNNRRLVGAPTETALLAAAAQGGLTKEKAGWETLRENPFDSSRKRMSVLAKRGNEKKLFCKGAPELLLGCCTKYLARDGEHPMTPEIRRKFQNQNTAMAGEALRVLGFCYKNGDNAQENDMVFVGMAGIQDPPRKEAFEAVKKCRQAGIRPVMITGDHAATAKAIAKQLDIFRNGDRVVTGKELDAFSDQQLSEILPEVSVFARVTPAHKLRIVRAFKKHGDVVAMTGDGVNDAPAVKEADIGVSMGATGTDVTKEAAALILLDDNFATLVAAVEEGRTIYQNIRKFIRYLLSCNTGEVFTMFFTMLCGMPIPLLPIQILLINLVTDGLPAVALGLEPPDRTVMDLEPRPAEESVFSHGLGFTIIMRGLLIGLTTVAVFVALLGEGLEIARTGALMTLVATQLIHVFECKSETKGLFGINPLNNWWLIGAVGISVAMLGFAVYTPFLSGVFGTAALEWEQLKIVLSYSAAVPFLSSVILAVKGHIKIQH